jgi:hypothetical protein
VAKQAGGEEMHINPIGNGIKRFATMENGGTSPAAGLDPRHLQPFDVGGVTAGVPFVVAFQTVAGTSDLDAFDTTVGIPFPARVINMWGFKTGAAGVGDTVTLKKNTTAISDAIDCNIADNLLLTPASMDDAQMDLARGDNLRLSQASDALARVYVTLLPLAAF